jgi:hypothetical protein
VRWRTFNIGIIGQNLLSSFDGPVGKDMEFIFMSVDASERLRWCGVTTHCKRWQKVTAQIIQKR